MTELGQVRKKILSNPLRSFFLQKLNYSKCLCLIFSSVDGNVEWHFGLLLKTLTSLWNTSYESICTIDRSIWSTWESVSWRLHNSWTIFSRFQMNSCCAIACLWHLITCYHRDYWFPPNDHNHQLKINTVHHLVTHIVGDAFCITVWYRTLPNVALKITSIQQLLLTDISIEACYGMRRQSWPPFTSHFVKDFFLPILGGHISTPGISRNRYKFSFFFYRNKCS